MNNRDSKKVLYLGGFELPDRNAAAQRVISMAKTMRKTGYDVEFIGITKKNEEIGQHLEFDGFKYTSYKYPSSIKEWIYQVTRFVPLNVIEEKSPYAVVLYNFPAIAQKRIINLCHQKGIKVVADLTEWYVTGGNSIRDIIKKWDTKKRMICYSIQMDGVIAISKYLYDFYKKKVKTVYIPATVDLQDEKWRRNREIAINRPIKLVYAGSPGTGRKDKLDVLVKAVANNSHFVLDVYGITKEQYVLNFGGQEPDNTVRFHGRVTHLDAINMICESDFDVIIRDDNLVTRAGFPTKFVEAYSCGTPVIATASSNITDYLKDGENGFIVDERQSLKQVLDRLAKMSEDELIAIKRNAISLFDFDYRNYVNEIQKIIG